jgi:hypothetical protein
MADVAAVPQENKSTVGKAREWITSTILISFTSFVALACVVALSSTLTQTRMSSITIDGVPLTIWKLDDIRVQWAKVRDAIQILSDEITKVEYRRADIVGKEAAATQEFSVRNTILVIRLDELLFRLVDSEFEKKVHPRRDANPKEHDPGFSPAQQYGQLNALRDAVLKERGELKSLYDELDAAYDKYSSARGDRLDRRARREAMIQQIKGLQDAVSGSRTSLETLYRRISPRYTQVDDGKQADQPKPADIDDATRSRIENALYELHSGRGPLGIVVNWMVTTQPDILTLALVILMGVLGSSLQMTYAFFKQHRIEKVGAYLLRVCVGAITALVIFIVAKAGVPVIADASRLGGDAAINPYFVSFLAIISGLMSENAIVSVQNQGARFFGADAKVEPDRWARQDLRETFKTSSRDPERVKRLLQAKDEEFHGWVTGKDPIPANVQMIIAGVLQIPPRDLYTDIPPDQAGTTT